MPGLTVPRQVKLSNKKQREIVQPKTLAGCQPQNVNPNFVVNTCTTNLPVEHDIPLFLRRELVNFESLPSRNDKVCSEFVHCLDLNLVKSKMATTWQRVAFWDIEGAVPPWTSVLSPTKTKRLTTPIIFSLFCINF